MLPFLFASYKDAAEKLYDVLPIPQMQDEEWLLLCLSPSAASIVDFISRKAELEFDFVFSESIYAPNNNTCIIAVVSETEDVVIQEALTSCFGISLDFIYGEAKRKYEENILKNVYKYRKGASLPEITNKNVLLIDEGAESGMRVLAASKTVLAERAKSVSFAAPIIPQDTASMLETELDGIYACSRVVNFVNTEFYYKKENILTQEEILKILESNKFFVPFQKSQGDE